MKRTLLFIACALTSVMIQAQVAQNEYRPLVEEGKHWTYDNFMPLRPAMYDHYYFYDLKGDTLIAGRQCLKMYSENGANNNRVNYEAALYEENKKVYCFFPGRDEAVLLYDFDCEVGDTLYYLHDVNQAVVKAIQTEDNNGIAIRRYTLHPINFNPYWNDEGNLYDFSWIEGVGATKDFFGMLPMDGNYNTLNACELNGEKLYQTIEPDYTEKGYHKMGIEGKRWNYIHYYLDENGEHSDPYSYVVKGDTVIRRTTYKKLYYQDEKTERFECLLYEEGRTLYKNTDLGNNSYDSPLLVPFFYFDRDDFGRVFTWKAENEPGNTNWMVYGVDTIEVNDCQFRRYTCLQKYSEDGEELSTIEYDGEGVWHDIWVEGVGSASCGIEDQHPLHEPKLQTTSEYTYFVSCYEDGKCIFTAEDFNAPAIKHKDIAYRPFVEDGKVWKVGALNSGNPVQLAEYFYFDGDTIIDGRACKRMMRQQYVCQDYEYYDLISPQYVGAWYEESQKVYFYDASTKQLGPRCEMMYDFSANTNDTLMIGTDFYVIGPRLIGDISGFKGAYRNVMMCKDGDSIVHSTPWLEGVGGVYGPTMNVIDGELADPEWFLMSCTVGDEVIYLNNVYKDGTTPESAEARKRFDFTHTIKTQPKAPRKWTRARSTSPADEGQTLYGEYNNLLLDINLTPLDDAYLVRITDETGKVAYEKTVNAASIVSLNIDISAYAAGRYTVTVDNSLESFTGIFETRTSGISDVTRLNNNEETINKNAYNLQGQRINSLQKGLYIVNGRKLYVK